MTIKKLFILLGSAASLISCGKPECRNTNPVFESASPDSRAYKIELARLIKTSKPGDIRYFAKGYTDTKTADYLILEVMAESFCATATVALEHNDAAISRLRKNGGKGYYNAELAGLKLNVKAEGELAYLGCDEIID